MLARDPHNVKTAYELPDGKAIVIGDARFNATEALFTPSLLGISSGGIHEAAYNAILKCETDIYRYLFGCILLAGGNTMFPGTADRMNRELAYLSIRHDSKAIAPPERKYSAWLGGSTFASRSSFAEQLKSAEEYEETGSSIVRMKCF